MKTKVNCWEFKKCGKEPGGAHVDDLGICPAATEKNSMECMMAEMQGGVAGFWP